MDLQGETPVSRARKSGYQVLIDLLLHKEREYSEEEMEGASQLRSGQPIGD